MKPPFEANLFQRKGNMNKIAKFSLIVLFLAAAAVSYADVKLPAIFSDNMVLQQKSNAAVWGWADPGEKIAVTTSWKKSANTAAGKNGRWILKLTTPKAGGPYTITIKGKNTVELKNVMLGEVWVCSGQSNMQWSMRASENPDENIAKAKYPNIRLFSVQRTTAEKPKDDCVGTWSACTPETVANFSAVAYYFGKHLADELKIPIGLIHTSWGGTPAEAWTRKEILQSDSDFAPILKRQQQKEAAFPEAMKKYLQALEDWKAKAEKAKAEGKRAPRRPRQPVKINSHSPASLYNGMIAPLIPYGIKGAIWYQGESNVSRAYQYRKLFPAMIRNWRNDWQQGDFPFYFVQIAPFNYRGENQQSAELREAQLWTLSLKNTGMAVISDIGNIKNIHPKNKLDVGKRLALWALAKDYGRKKLVYSGPLYRSIKREGNKIRISFKHVGSGLVASDGKELTHFTIAAKDKKFVPATAVIEGKTVVVFSEIVPKPLAVRYGWSNTAEPNLANKEGLPASTFRTEDWPGVSFDAR
jgi:sialate O-acetylesterase